MSQITHEKQREIWEEEHHRPKVLPQMDSHEVSSGVARFVRWLVDNGQKISSLHGVEMCCGKGRNVIELALQGSTVIGLDFSLFAIAEAKKRAKIAGANQAKFIACDATLTWPIDDDSQDFVIDCFGSTDIESAAGRRVALDNVIRVLKPGGYLFLYLLSTDDTFHKDMRRQNAGPDSGSFLHPMNGKYEKSFADDEVKKMYQDLDIVEFRRQNKKSIFFGKEYDMSHIWAIFQKTKVGQ
jgi:ubiquinone/menaquinone biosynthesis C-methylase UbiE